MAGLDDGRSVVAVLPARLDEDLFGLTDQPKHDDEARGPLRDGLDRCGARGQGEQGHDLPGVLPELLAQGVDHPIDTAGDDRVADGLGLCTNGGFIHPGMLPPMRPVG